MYVCSRSKIRRYWFSFYFTCWCGYWYWFNFLFFTPLGVDESVFYKAVIRLCHPWICTHGGYSALRVDDMLFDSIRLIADSNILSDLGSFLLVYILIRCILTRWGNVQKEVNSSNYFIVVLCALVFGFFLHIYTINSYDVPTVLPKTVPDTVLNSPLECRVLADYFSLHQTPNLVFIYETLIPFLQNKDNFSFLALVQKYTVAHTDVSLDSRSLFLESCHNVFISHISNFYYENDFLPTNLALLWEDVNWYFYVHGSAPDKNFLTFLFNYLTQDTDFTNEDLVKEYLKTCPAPSSHYINFLKSLNCLPTVLANAPEFAPIHKMLMNWPKIEEFNTYLKPLVSDKFVDLYTLHKYLDSHNKNDWSVPFLKLLIDYMENYPIISEEDLKKSYLALHNSPNEDFINYVLNTSFAECNLKKNGYYEIYKTDMIYCQFHNTVKEFLAPFVGDKVVDTNALEFYVLLHYDELNIEFIQLYIEYLDTFPVIDVEDLLTKYQAMHKTHHQFFINLVRARVYFEQSLEKSPFYLLHRSNLATFQANTQNYSNWLNTDLTEESTFFLKLVFFSYLLFMLALFGLIITRANLVIFLLFTELMIFCSIFLLIVVSQYLELPFGQIYALLLLGVAASEAAIGLGLLLVVYRIRGHLTFK